jgi:hypothetical protein
VLAHVHQLGRDQVEIVEKPLRGWSDKGAFADILRQLAVGGFKGAGVVPQAGKNVAGVPLLRVNREVRRERERSLVEPLRAERFVTKGPIAVTIGRA